MFRNHTAVRYRVVYVISYGFPGGEERKVVWDDIGFVGRIERKFRRRNVVLGSVAETIRIVLCVLYIVGGSYVAAELPRRDFVSATPPVNIPIE